MNVKKINKEQKISYLPDIYVNSIEVSNGIVDIKYYLRDTLSDDYLFDWFDDKDLLKNLSVTLILEVSGNNPIVINDNLYNIIYDYKDIKFTKSDVDSFSERAYYFQFSKKFNIDKYENCTVKTKIDLLKTTRERKEVILSGEEKSYPIFVSGSIPNQYYYTDSRDKVFIGSVQQVGSRFFSANNEPLNRINLPLNYLVKDLRKLDVEFPKFIKFKETPVNFNLKTRKEVIARNIRAERNITPSGLAQRISGLRTNLSTFIENRNRNGINIRNNIGQFGIPNVSNSPLNRNRRDLENINNPASRQNAFDQLPQNSTNLPNQDNLNLGRFLDVPFMGSKPAPDFTFAVQIINIEPEIRDIYLSTSSDKKVYGLFSIDIDQVLTNKSEFYLYFKGNEKYRKKCLDNTFITKLKVYKHKVPNSEQERKTGTPKKLVAESSDSYGQTQINFNNNDTIREVIGLNTDFKSRSFTFIDNTYLPEDEGKYYYEIEVEITDFSKILLNEDFKTPLENSIKVLQKYIDDIKLHSSNSKIPLFASDAFYETIYPNYVSLTNGWSLLDTLNSTSFLYAFLNEIEFDEMIKSFSAILHPLSTNIELLSKLLESYKTTLSKLEKIIGYIEDITSKINTQKDTGKYLYEINKIFKQETYQVNMSYRYGTGIDFFSVTNFTSRENTQQNGILELTPFVFQNRITREVNKYVSRYSENLLGINEYLTPTFIDLNTESFDIINPNFAQNNSTYLNLFYSFYRYFGKNENRQDLSSLFYMLANDGVYIKSIDQRNNVSENSLFPSTIGDTNPDSSQNSLKYITDTGISDLFISINKNKEIPNQFLNSSRDFIPSFIFNSAKQRNVDNNVQATSNFVLTPNLTNDKYCRAFFTYAALSKIENITNNTNTRLNIRRINTNSNLPFSLFKEIEKIGYIPINNEFFLTTNEAIPLPRRTTEKIFNEEITNNFISNNVRSEFIQSNEKPDTFNNKAKLLIESI